MIAKFYTFIYNQTLIMLCIYVQNLS